MREFVYKTYRKLLNAWVKPKVHGCSQVTKGLRDDAPVFYVLEYRSYADLLVIDQICEEKGLPAPYQRSEIEQLAKKRGFFVLKRNEGLVFKRSTSRQYSETAIELVNLVCGNKLEEVQLIPVSVYWGYHPDKQRSLKSLLFGSGRTLVNPFRKFLIILMNGRNVFVQFGHPLSVKGLIDSEMGSARAERKLFRILRVHFRQVRISILGPDLSHRKTMIDALIDSPAVRQAIEIEAKEQNKHRADIRKQAKKDALEICSDLSYPMVKVFDWGLGLLWNRMYKGIDVNHVERIKDIAEKNAIVYVPCHRSHIDYLLLSYVLYHKGLALPHIAAGVNLNMPVAGTFLRKVGAFYMRRSFKNQRLYTAVFNEYVGMIYSRGHSMEYFVEGGRSRSGRTLPAKTGLLSMTARTYLREQKPLAFVPVYIGYEKIIEVTSYQKELEGAKKQKESVFDIFSTLKSLNSSFGKVTVNFAEPIVMDQFLNEYRSDWRDAVKEDGERAGWITQAVNTIGDQVVTRINEAAAVNPVNIISLMLLCSPQRKVSLTQLKAELNICLNLCRKTPYSSDISTTDLDPDEIIDYVETLDLLEQSDSVIGFDPASAPVMGYYRNNIIHLFVIPALLIKLIELHDGITNQRLIDGVMKLYPFLKQDFILRWDDVQLTSHIEACLKVFCELELIEFNKGEWSIDPENTDGVALQGFASLITPTLQRYGMLTALLIETGSEEVKQAGLEKRYFQVLKRLHQLHDVSEADHSDRSLIKGFIQTLKATGLVGVGDERKLVFDTFPDEFTTDLYLATGPEVLQIVNEVVNHSDS
ncbi:MAG: glycerol-3-phosphate 1-O-acyltransferase PlsB [Pseudomonadales bacterium]|nr:glycerol-3-phosphate 1-O-acyltransferase PlsB [Pseudomonadales bacterium]